MKPYPAYKDSEIEWIGKIPNNWETIKLKYIMQNFDGRRIPLNSEERVEMQGNYPYYGSNGIVDQVNDYLFDGEYILLGEDGAPFFEAYKDVAFLVTGKFWVNNHAHILKASLNHDQRFLTYLLNCVDYRKYITGSTRDKLTQNDMKSIILSITKLDEQKTIATYLDHKTAQIDDLIAKKERMIELLKEERTAIIDQAVTKGLDPNVDLKTSGIEWLGKIPKHWDLKRLKYLDNVIMGQSPESEDCNKDKTGIPFLQGNADFSDVNPMPSVWCEQPNKFAEKDAILLSVRAPVGAVNIADQTFGIGRGLCAIRPKCSHKKYLYYKALCLVNELNRIATGSTYTAVSVEQVNNVFVPNPDGEEQKAIANFLDHKTAQIDTQIKKITKTIDYIKEYRTALISEVVTGKIDVRGEQQ